MFSFKKKASPKEITSHEVLNPFAFEDLAPVSNADQVEMYLESLNWALSNSRIKNIAVTGPYGSGKSSMLQTFQKTHTGFHYLNISLASFREGNSFDESLENLDEQSKENIPGGLGNEAQRLIELSILQQMFYQVADNKIPDSRFKRINHLPQKKVNQITSVAFLTFLGIVLVLFPAYFEQVDTWKLAAQKYRGFTLILGTVFIVPGLIWTMMFLIRFFNGSGFKKLNISSGEIEINPKSETSILNKYFDEIVYFFQVNNYNVVIFEDLDRFNDPEIFTKLRELNILLNSSHQLNRHIVFIYAIKDDMFADDKMRTKFFEFIIPVIPVVNWFNSLEIFTRKMTNPSLNLSINESFLSDIMLYIDDMRVLKNIFNEFIIYKENLKGKLKQDKLLAIVIYKNIYPEDFAALHRNEGILFDVFNKKNEFVKRLIESKQEQKSELQAEISRLEQIELRKIKELRSAYILQFSTKIKDLITLEIDGHRALWELTSDDLFDKFQNAQTLNFYFFQRDYNRQSSGSKKMNFLELEKEVDEKRTYKERAEDINKLHDGTIKRYEEIIAKLNREIELLRANTLKEILNNNQSIIKQLPNQFHERKLLLYLVREGYIDEMYPSYISYFYEGSMTRRDMDFLIGVKDQEAHAFDYKLEKIPAILKRLNEAELKRDASFNIDLISYLFTHRQTYKTAYAAILERLADGSSMTFNFLDEFLKVEKHQELLMVRIHEWWPRCWVDFSDRANITELQRASFLGMLVRYADLNNISKLNVNGSLASYISSKRDFLEIAPPEQYSERVLKVIEKLGVKFNDLSLSKKTNSLFDFIYNKNHYKLNSTMINLMLTSKSPVKDLDISNLENSNYTILQQSSCIPLITYVESNLEEYLQNVVLALPSNTNESEESIVQILNNKELSIEIKSELLSKQNALIECITEITDVELWGYIFMHGSLAPAWYNVHKYYEQFNEINETLLDWLNQLDNARKLGSVTFKPDDRMDENAVTHLSLSILINNDIDQAPYEKLIRGIWYWKYPDLDISPLSEEKIEVLINLDKLGVTPKNYERLKENFSGYISLLTRDLAAYLATPSDYALDDDEFLALLEHPNLSIDQRLLIIDHLAEEITITKFRLANKVIKLLSETDKRNLAVNFIRSLFAVGIFSDDKVKLFNKYMGSVGVNEIRSILTDIKGGYEELVGNGRPKFPITDINRSIIGFLEKVGIISSFKIDQEKKYIRVNTKRSN